MIVEEGASVWYGAVIRADYAPVIVRAARERAGQRRDPRPARAHHRHRRGRHGRAQLRRARRDARSRSASSPTARSCSTARRSARGALVAAGSVVAAGTSIPAGMLAAGSPGSRAAAGQGQRRGDVGRAQSRRLRRARAAPPARHRVRRTRRELADSQTVTGTAPTGPRRGSTRSRARPARAG